MVAGRRANEAGWTDDMICALLDGLDEAIEIEALDAESTIPNQEPDNQETR